MVVLILRLTMLLRSYAFEYARVTNIDYEKRIIESFPYNTSVYYAMYKDHLYLVNGEGNDHETALHGTLVYIVTIYDVIAKPPECYVRLVVARTYLLFIFAVNG